MATIFTAIDPWWPVPTSTAEDFENLTDSECSRCRLEFVEMSAAAGMNEPLPQSSNRSMEIHQRRVGYSEKSQRRISEK